MATRRGPDNSVRVGIQGLINNVAWANVFWCQLTTSGTPPQSDLDNWLTAFQAAYKTRFAARTVTFTQYKQAQAQMFLPGGLALPSLIAMTGTGSGTGNTGQSQVECSILSWQTGVYWRGGKPRTYLPMMPQSVTADSRTLGAAEITALLSAAGGFRTDVNALTAGTITGTALGFVSFMSGGAARGTPLFFPYTGVKVHPRLGTQRRRLGKWQP